MEGVTILNQYMECIAIKPNITSLLIAGGIALVIGILFAFLIRVKGFWPFLLSVLLFGGLVFVLELAPTTQGWGTKVEEERYEVTISDNVSMTEFNKIYNIVEQRGDIYVVTKK